jgi:hypothetical protein
MGRPFAAYSRLESPKYEIMIKGGVHVWFRDGDEVSVDGKNPDCITFEGYGMTPPGCEERNMLIDPARQREITRVAARNFLDGYLKADKAALARLRALGETYKEIDLRCEL